MSAPETLTSLDGFASLVPAAPVSHSRTPGRSAPTNESLVSEGWGWNVDFGSFIGPGAGYSLFGGADAGDESLIGPNGGFWPSDRVQLNNHSTPGIFTEPQWRASLMWSRWLDDYNPLVIGFTNHILNFIGSIDVSWARRGQNPTATGAGEEDGGDDLLKAVEQVWEEIAEANDWGEGDDDREQETGRRLIRDGDVTLRLGAGGPGRDMLPWIRNIEPEQIRTPTGVIPGDWSQSTNDWRWGVHCDPEDEDTELAYWVCDPDSGGAKGEVVPADQVVRSKNNVDRTIRRGKGDYFCTDNHLRRVMGVLSNMESTAQELSEIAWIQEWANATPDQLRSLLSQRQETYGPGQGRDDSPTTGGSMPGRNGFPLRNHGGTKVLHVGPQTQFKSGPVTEGVPSFNSAIEASLKAVRFRMGLPDSFVWGSGDSFAGVLVTGSPFVLEIEKRQKKLAAVTKKVAVKAMNLAERSGRLPPGTMVQVKCIITPKPVVMADESKKSTVVAQKLRDKIMSPQQAIREDDRDPKQVVADWHAWEKEFPAPGAPGSAGPGGAPPGPGPVDPTETANPPGSAGGDGTDPEPGLDDVFNAEGGGDYFFDNFLVKEHGGTNPPPGEGWLYNEAIHHWYKAETGETHPGVRTPEQVESRRQAAKDYQENGTKSKAFRAWFGESKVVDAKGEPQKTDHVDGHGKPITVYHGTPNKFDEFELHKAGSNIDSGFLGTGFYFTTDPKVAEYYSKIRASKEPTIIPAYLSLKNPFEWGKKTLGARGLVMRGDKLPEAIHDKVIEKTGFKFDPDAEIDFNDERRVSEAIREVLVSMGHDGVVSDISAGKVSPASKEYVAFHPTQIKSVNNAGTFDPHSSKVSEAAGPQGTIRKEGEVWQSGSRYFTLKNGRTVPAPAPPVRQPPRRQPTQPRQNTDRTPKPPAPPAPTKVGGATTSSTPLTDAQKQVVADWHAWEKEFPAPGNLPNGNTPPGTQPPGVKPAPEPGGPPGSGGGDGTDPEQGIEDLFNPVAESAPVFVQERATVGGTHPPPGTGWLYDHQKNHWYKSKKGKPTGETHPGIPNTTEPVPKERISTKEEALAAVSKALEKFKKVPKPTPEELAENKAGLAKLGANKYRRNLVGNSTDRAKRRAALLTEFGDGKTCPCIYCGVKIGNGTLEQDKIITTAQGGRYRMANLVPACTNCNKHRSDTPFREIAKVLPKNAPAA